MDHSLAFIGAGNMAEAIAKAVITTGIHPPEKLIAADPSEARLSLFRAMGVGCTPSNSEAARSARTVMLCVKPQMMAAALTDLAPVLDEQQCLVTIAAGISTRFIESSLPAGKAWHVVRVMPNTPMLHGAGATAMCRGTHATDEDATYTRHLFESAGLVIDVAEEHMDTVTAVSGSGPAYFFYLCEHLIEAATQLGLSAAQARALVYQTATGAARMLAMEEQSPAQLRRNVTSPGGTTQAAMEIFELGGVGPTIQQAVNAAQRRGRELGR